MKKVKGELRALSFWHLGINQHDLFRHSSCLRIATQWIPQVHTGTAAAAAAKWNNMLDQNLEQPKELVEWGFRIIHSGAIYACALAVHWKENKRNTETWWVKNSPFEKTWLCFEAPWTNTVKNRWKGWLACIGMKRDLKENLNYRVLYARNIKGCVCTVQYGRPPCVGLLGSKSAMHCFTWNVNSAVHQMSAIIYYIRLWHENYAHIVNSTPMHDSSHYICKG